MSYTQYYLKATCQVSDGTVLDDLVTDIVDYLGNHEEELEALYGLAEEPAEDAHRIIKAYLSLEGTSLTINHASEECDTGDSDIAEFLCKHIAHLQTSPHMDVTWVSIDSREGLCFDHYLLDQNGEIPDDSISEPHTPSQPAHIPQDLAELLGSITNYIAGTEFEDLIQRSIEEGWTLDQARENVAFKSMLVEWYLDPHGHANPERYALTELKQSANEDDYAKLDQSLKIND